MMTLLEIAAIYTKLVKLDREIPETALEAKDQVSILRAEYHELLMAKMREEKIPFADRYDAANKAFQMISESVSNKVVESSN